MKFFSVKNKGETMIVTFHLNMQKQKDHGMRVITSVYIISERVNDVNVLEKQKKCIILQSSCGQCFYYLDSKEGWL